MNNSEKLYAIWSIEHSAWWKRTKYGYVKDFKDAGYFPFTEAESIVEQANLLRREECMIPIEQIVISQTNVNFRK